MRRLVCAFVARKPPKTGFLAPRPILFYRNKKWVYDQWSNICYFLIYEAQRCYWFFLFNLLNLGLRTLTLLYTQKVEISNVCALLCKYNAYGQQLLFFLFLVDLWWNGSNFSALLMCHIKIHYNWRWHVFCMQKRNSLCLIACKNPSTLLPRLVQV